MVDCHNFTHFPFNIALGQGQLMAFICVIYTYKHEMSGKLSIQMLIVGNFEVGFDNSIIPNTYHYHCLSVSIMRVMTIRMQSGIKQALGWWKLLM